MPLDWTDIIVPEGVKVPATPQPLNDIGDYLKNQTTDDVPEGTTNQYYTESRAEAVTRSIVINDLVTGGTDSPLSAEQGKVLHSVRKVSDSRDSTAYNMSLSINSDGYLVATFSSI